MENENNCLGRFLSVKIISEEIEIIIFTFNCNKIPLVTLKKIDGRI